jgi:branched-chain amino acid transport system ATP-binding protein
MKGRPEDESPSAQREGGPVTAPPPLLAVRGLAKAFGGVQAVDGVDFDVAPGELLALIGPNGAGKSTCFDCINGQLRADRGSVRLGADELLGRRPREIWRLGVGRTFQIAATFASMTVRENVQMALLSHHRELAGGWTPAAARHIEAAQRLLQDVGLADVAEVACATLAYGDLKGVELAIALAHGPRLLLMDEPTAGMAPRERNDLVALVRRLVLERGIGVLFTEHSMDVVFAFADRIVVMARGRIIAQGLPAAIRADPLVREVYFGAPGELERAAAA